MSAPTEPCENGHFDWIIRMEDNTWICETCIHDNWVKNHPEEVEDFKKRGRELMNKLGF